VKWEGRYEGAETLAAGSPARLALVWRGGGEAQDFRGLLRRAGAKAAKPAKSRACSRNRAPRAPWLISRAADSAP